MVSRLRINDYLYLHRKDREQGQSLASKEAIPLAVHSKRAEWSGLQRLPMD